MTEPTRDDQDLVPDEGDEPPVDEPSPDELRALLGDGADAPDADVPEEALARAGATAGDADGDAEEGAPAAPAADVVVPTAPRRAPDREPPPPPRSGRSAPHDLLAERSVLGALLVDPDRLLDVVDLVHAGDFHDRRHRALFEAIVTMDERGQAIDAVALGATLRATGQLGDVGGATYLAQVLNSVSSAAHLRHHATLVAETSKLRHLIHQGETIVERAYRTAPEPDEVQHLIDESEAGVFSVARGRDRRNATGVKDVLGEVFRQIEAQQKRGEYTGIPSGFYDLDDMLGGFNPGELTVIAARPAMGKTAFALNLLDHATAHRAECLGREPVALFFSLEMGRIQIVQRMLCARAGVEAHRVRTGRMHDREYSDLMEAAGGLSRSKLFVDDTPGLSILALRSRARRLKAEHGLDMIVIDYLQLVTAKAESRQQEIGLVSRSLKELSRELEVPVLSLAQLSRSVESREEKRPQLSDLRESGSIEQDADVVLMLYRPEYYFPTDENSGKAQVLCVKHRNGPTGKVDLQFQGALLRFSNREPSMAEPILP